MTNRFADPQWLQLTAMVRATSLPTLLLEPPAEEIVAANDAAATLLIDRTGDEVAGTAIGEFFVGDMSGGLGLVARGTVSAYETRRRVRGTGEDVQVWVRRLPLASLRCAVVTLLGGETGRSAAVSLPVGSVVAIGSADHRFVIEHLTADIAGILGLEAERLIGTSLLQLIDPIEAGRLLELATEAVASGRASTQSVQVRMRMGGRSRCEVLLVPNVPGEGYAFTIMIVGEQTEDPGRAFRHALDTVPVQARAAAEARKAAALGNRERLAKLGNRELEVVTELLAGNRVPAIARRLFLSQGTVRNHLSAAYRKLGVTDQQGLIDLFRPSEPPSWSP